MSLWLMHLKALWLFYIHLFLYHPIEKWCLDIHLVNLPSHLRSKGNYGSDRSVSGYWGEGLFIIDPFLLSIPLSHKPGFKFFDAAICNKLDLVDPP